MAFRTHSFNFKNFLRNVLEEAQRLRILLITSKWVLYLKLVVLVDLKEILVLESLVTVQGSEDL